MALNVLNKVFINDAYANIALDEELSTSHLTELDRNLVTALVYGTISKKLTLEWYLKPFIKKVKPWVYHLLLLSAYQIVFMDKIPTSAAVDEGVKLAKKVKGQQVAGFVNAVLRNFSRTPLQELPVGMKERLSVKFSMPLNLTEKFLSQFGEERTVKIFESLDKPSYASIRLASNHDISLSEQMNRLDENFGSLRPSKLSPVGLIVNHGNFVQAREFQDGNITIQDETSQLVAPQMEIHGEEQILDACAAPGGKTVHMAQYLTTGHITALDLYEHKLRLIEQNAIRLHVADKITTLKFDATKVYEKFGREKFDRILVDAPCSGIGLIRRKPDIRYRKDTIDFIHLQKIQLSILEAASQTLKKYGIMMYSTCTIFDEENFDVIEKFLAKHSDFEQVALSHEKKDIIADGCIFITPEMYHTDGFFIAKLRKYK